MDKQNRQKMVEERIAWSAEYVKKAEPIIRDLLRGGYILRVEGKQEEVCKALDMVCGTDYIYLYPEKHHAWGMACRVQKYNKANFTIRKAVESGAQTELDKRRFAISKGGIYPFLTMQMFVDDQNHKIRRLGIAKTVDIIDALDKGMGVEKDVRWDDGGKSTFIYVEWDDLRAAGYTVMVYDATKTNVA